MQPKDAPINTFLLSVVAQGYEEHEGLGLGSRDKLSYS